MRFYLFDVFLLLVSIVMVGGDEGSGSVVMERLVMVRGFRVLHLVEEVDDLFGCLLDDAHQVCLLVFAVYDHFGDL
jgi:hypothetical protein